MDRWTRGSQQDNTRIESGKQLILVDGPWYPARPECHDADYWRWHAEKDAARKEWENIRERTTPATDRLRRENKFVGKVPWALAVGCPGTLM